MTDEIKNTMVFLPPTQVGKWVMKGTLCNGRLDVFFKSGEGATLSFVGTKEEWEDIMAELKKVEQ